MSGAEPRARTAWLLCLAAVVVGGVLRAIPCGNDFWLDEIWTYYTVRALSSPLEIFTALPTSNNNHLNSLLFYALGDREQWIVYRLPALAAGTASIALAAWIAHRRGRLEAVFAAVLTAACFSLLHFSSEARGYSLAVAFSLLAYAALQRQLERGDAASALAFGASVLLATLSHLTALFFYAGAVAESAAVLLSRRDVAARGAWRRLVALHALPLLGLALFTAVTLRHMVVGGGYPAEIDRVVARSFGFSLGLPVREALAWPYGVLGALVLALGARLLAREGDRSWILFVITVAIAPLAALLATRPEVVAVRYFLVGIAFYLLLGSYLLAWLYRRGRAGRVASLLLLALFAIGNGVHVAAFLEHGRGGFRAALAFMERETRGPEIVVGSDHDFRNGLVLRFYAERMHGPKRFVYVPRGEVRPGGPEWFVRHAAQRPPAPDPAIVDRAGHRYELAAEFDHAAISGFYWAVYHNVEASGAPSG